MNIKVEVIHNASIISAAGCCGLQVNSPFPFRTFFLHFFDFFVTYISPLIFFLLSSHIQNSFIILGKLCPWFFGQTPGSQTAFIKESKIIENLVFTLFAS